MSESAAGCKDNVCSANVRGQIGAVSPPLDINAKKMNSRLGNVALEDLHDLFFAYSANDLIRYLPAFEEQ